MKLIERFMGQCATVDEVLELLRQEKIPFHLLRPTHDYQVATNFRQSSTVPKDVTCSRFKKAKQMLAGNKDISVESFRAILQATHQKSKWPTQYSNIYDLKSGDVYVYHQHNFGKAVRLNLSDELKKGAREVRLAVLFK